MIAVPADRSEGQHSRSRRAFVYRPVGLSATELFLTAFADMSRHVAVSIHAPARGAPHYSTAQRYSIRPPFTRVACAARRSRSNDVARPPDGPAIRGVSKYTGSATAVQSPGFVELGDGRLKAAALFLIRASPRDALAG